MREATSADIDAVTRCITLAFATDPVWGVALQRPDGRTDHHEPYWRLFVEAAMLAGGVTMTDGGESVAVWILPGQEELSAEGLATLEALVVSSLTPAGATAMFELYERFEASRAGRPPHAYLSLLATHPDRRGQGIGQALLTEDLARWDADGVPAYLESTNPANDHRYVRAGFGPVGGFRAVLDDAWVSAMWRPVGGS